jgi:hypothetical protein
MALLLLRPSLGPLANLGELFAGYDFQIVKFPDDAPDQDFFVMGYWFHGSFSL